MSTCNSATWELLLLQSVSTGSKFRSPEVEFSQRNYTALPVRRCLRQHRDLATADLVDFTESGFVLPVQLVPPEVDDISGPPMYAMHVGLVVLAMSDTARPTSPMCTARSGSCALRRMRCRDSTDRWP